MSFCFNFFYTNKQIRENIRGNSEAVIMIPVRFRFCIIKINSFVSESQASEEVWCQKCVEPVNVKFDGSTLLSSFGSKHRRGRSLQQIDHHLGKFVQPVKF